MSTFYELYSDFQDAIKSYTEEIDVTPLAFMRLYSKGMQYFQRETEFIERQVEITYDDTNSRFIIPDDVLRMIAVKDSNDYSILLQDFQQYIQNIERWKNGTMEVPVDYARHLMPTYHYASYPRIATIYNRVLMLYPYNSDTSLYIYYVMDIHAISSDSSQWNRLDDNGNPVGWYPLDQRFDLMFKQASVTPTLKPYEDAFLKYAIAEYIKSKGSINYKVFEDWYMQEVERGKMNKPLYYKEGSTKYMMAPYS